MLMKLQFFEKSARKRHRERSRNCQEIDQVPVVKLGVSSTARLFWQKLLTLRYLIRGHLRKMNKRYKWCSPERFLKGMKLEQNFRSTVGYFAQIWLILRQFCDSFVHFYRPFFTFLSSQKCSKLMQNNPMCVLNYS